MNSEDLVLKVRADGTNVKETFQGIAKETDKLKITTEKTTSAFRQFANDLKNVRDASDLAGVATRALAQVIGASLAGTAVVVAGKALLDAFNAVQKVVSETRTSVENSLKAVQGSAEALTFENAIQQAEMLYKEAEKVDLAVKKLEENKLQSFIAEISGAKEEMRKLAQETINVGRELQKSGLEKGASELSLESRRTELDKAAASASEKFKPQIDAARKYLNQIESTFDADIKNAKTKEEADKIRGRKQDAQNKLEQSIIDSQTAASEAVAKKEEELRKKANLEQNKLISQDQDAKDRSRQYEMDEFQKQIDKRNQRTKEESAEFYRRLEEETKRQKEKQRLERDASDLKIDELNLEERLINQRKEIIRAEGRVAELGIRGPGTGRGPGQKPTSLEIGAFNRAQKAAQDEAFRLRQGERERIKTELQGEEIRRRMFAGERLGNELPKVSGFEINKRLERNLAKSIVEGERAAYDDARNARAGAQATEETLRAVKENLKAVLDELKTYAHAS